MNEDLLTEEEKAMPMGLGFVAAAERLGLIYLNAPKTMIHLLGEYVNSAWDFAMHGNLPYDQAWEFLNGMGDELAVILSGRNPKYMATSWFTEPEQLAASLASQFQATRPDDPKDALWRASPIQAKAREYIAWFVDLAEGALEPWTDDPLEKKISDHVRQYAGDFLGMPREMISVTIKHVRK